MIPKMVPVVSSDLHSVGYDGFTGRLYISFNNGGLYEYDSVPHVVYEQLLQAGSHGKYFHSYIKGRYAYRRVG